MEANVLLIVKMLAVKYSLINIKICEDKTCVLIKKIKGFQLPSTNDIKTCLPPFKYLYKPFSKYLIKFIIFLQFELFQYTILLLYSLLYITLKQVNMIKSQL